MTQVDISAHAQVGALAIRKERVLEEAERTVLELFERAGSKKEASVAVAPGNWTRFAGPVEADPKVVNPYLTRVSFEVRAPLDPFGEIAAAIEDYAPSAFLRSRFQTHVRFSAKESGFRQRNFKKVVLPYLYRRHLLSRFCEAFEGQVVGPRLPNLEHVVVPKRTKTALRGRLTFKELRPEIAEILVSAIEERSHVFPAKQHAQLLKETAVAGARRVLEAVASIAHDAVADKHSEVRLSENPQRFKGQIASRLVRHQTMDPYRVQDFLFTVHEDLTRAARAGTLNFKWGTVEADESGLILRIPHQVAR